MITRAYRPPQLQRGVVLVTSLLLLVVVTIMALSMFRGFGIQEKMAGNMREKQRALQAAVSAQTYAEQWLIANSGTSPPVVCAAPVQSANAQQGQICSNQLWNVTQQAGGAYSITNERSGLVLTTASTSAGALVTQQANTGSALQQWTIN